MTTLTQRHFLLGLGANLPSAVGQPVETLRATLGALDCDGFSVDAVSRLYRNPAYPPSSGPEFVNAAALVTTAWALDRVLAHIHATEASLGRKRSERWSARSIDIDILCADDLVVPDADTVRQWIDLSPEMQKTAMPDILILPHPRMQDRAFVLVPAAEILPDWRHPILDRTLQEMADALPRAALDDLHPLVTSDSR